MRLQQRLADRLRSSAAAWSQGCVGRRWRREPESVKVFLRRRRRNRGTSPAFISSDTSHFLFLRPLVILFLRAASNFGFGRLFFRVAFLQTETAGQAPRSGDHPQSTTARVQRHLELRNPRNHQRYGARHQHHGEHEDV